MKSIAISYEELQAILKLWQNIFLQVMKLQAK